MTFRLGNFTSQDFDDCLNGMFTSQNRRGPTECFLFTDAGVFSRVAERRTLIDTSCYI